VGQLVLDQVWLEAKHFVRAVTVGLNNLETGRDVSFDDASIRLALDPK
jgi:hypothetical protein